MYLPFARSTRVARHTVAARLSKRGRGVALLEALENRQLLSTTYYVSPSGSDSNSGTSQTSPWQSIAKVNSATLAAGDTVLFQGGQTFSGSLQFRSGDGGSSTTPVTISSYGSGRATINSGTSDGAYDYGTSGIWIENLIFVGSAGSDAQDGVRFEAPANDSQSNGRVINCDISGYQTAGIYVIGDSNAGFNSTQFSNNTIHNNVQNGIVYASFQNYVNKSALISNNTIYGNAGIAPGSSNVVSGSGIEMGGVNGATIQYNYVYNNGASGNGGCGIWCYASTGVVMQYNISAHNTTAYGHDGDGFDLDLDTQNSIVQYNYAYENAGAGFMMDQWDGDNNFKNNIIRYNIAQDDGRQDTYAELCVFGQVANSIFYNNDAYLTPAAGDVGIRVKYSALGGSYVSGLVFANNVVISTGGSQLVNVPSDEVQGSNLTFLGNDYYSSGSSFSIAFGSTSYSSVSSWASATGEEELNGTVDGMQSSPALTSAGNGAALTNPTQLNTLSAYTTTSGSPLINHGINVAATYGYAAPSSDFYGDMALQGGAYDIGAYESGGQAGPSTSTGSSGTGSSSNGSISGSVTAGSTALAGITVYLDNNNDKALDDGEASTVTNSSGAYSFSGLAAGAYIVRQILPGGDTQTSPSGGLGIHITLGSGQTSSGNTFTDTAPTTGSISGTIKAASAGLAGITVYLDNNNDKKLDDGELSTVTSSTGAYSFSGLAAGTYIVRQILPTGGTQNTPTDSDGIHITLSAGESSSGNVFSDTQIATASISGEIFNDANGDGKLDNSEAGVSDWELYIDLNNSGAYVSGDPTTTTNSSGDFTFSDLAAGTYIIRVMRPSGWSQTSPTDNYGQHITITVGQAVTGVLFGEEK